MNDLTNRRPLTSRNHGWARALAAVLVRARIAPNTISLASIVCAAGAALALAAWPERTDAGRWLLPIAAAISIQLRLLCNMLDGMVAVEGGRRSATGELFNEVPDRIADTLILVGAGIALHGLPWAIELGWATALLAMLTAYVRALGGGLGRPGCFHGPMAKPHRMAALTAACLATAAASAADWAPAAWILWWTLVVIAAGCVITAGRRLAAIASHLREVTP
jgi:phosphatidylglycerophosphate synthase